MTPTTCYTVRTAVSGGYTLTCNPIVFVMHTHTHKATLAPYCTGVENEIPRPACRYDTNNTGYKALSTLSGTQGRRYGDSSTGAHRFATQLQYPSTKPQKFPKARETQLTPTLRHGPHTTRRSTYMM